VHADNQVPLMAYVDLVRPALVAHSGVADVVHRGLWFLGGLAGHADNRVPLMAYADLVRPALVAHSSVADVGTWFLTGLSVQLSNRAILKSDTDLVAVVRSLPSSPLRDALLTKWT
jgi:hypothetical protein